MRKDRLDDQHRLRESQECPVHVMGRYCGGDPVDIGSRHVMTSRELIRGCHEPCYPRHTILARSVAIISRIPLFDDTPLLRHLFRRLLSHAFLGGITRTEGFSIKWREPEGLRLSPVSLPLGGAAFAGPLVNAGHVLWFHKSFSNQLGGSPSPSASMRR